MPELYLPQLGTSLTCEEGGNLYRILADKGLLEAPCGGKGTCGKCRVTADGVSVLACHHSVGRDEEIILPRTAEVSDIVSDGYMKKFSFVPRDGYGAAIDIGTTTVVAALYDLSSGRELRALSCLNSQKAYGQDVISRICYATDEPQGLEQLRRKICGDINNLVTQLLLRTNIGGEDLRGIVVAGNTTMIHLLAGRDPSSLAAAPYLPAFTGPLTLAPEELGLALPSAAVACLPAIASYVGGDITAGIVACGISPEGPFTLLLDIGTNGEIVLAGDGMIHCCSCAAGPALEGMNISCGTRASDGAIEAVSIVDGAFACQTIRGAAPSGICGSGLISAIAAMLRGGVISSSGRFTDHPLVRRGAGGKYVVLDQEHDIYLTQKDIRQVQLAKGAILSGILALLEASGRTEEDIGNVIVAGQFGAHLTAESLVGCGILPESWKDKITYAGNTSKSGAAICLLSPEENRRCEELAKNARYIELSTKDGYEALFVKCLNF